MITIYCYVRIIYMVYKSNKRLRDRAKEAPTSNAKKSRAIKASDVRLLKTVAAMAILAVVIYTPFSITLLLDRGQLPRRVWWFSNGLMHAFSCLGWFIYALTNNKIRRGIFHIFKKLSCDLCIIGGGQMESSMGSGSDGTGVQLGVPHVLGTSAGGISNLGLQLEKTNI